MIKDKQTINCLLARFMVGETTESEEQMLKDYFCSLDIVPDEWQPYAIMFKGFGKKKNLQKTHTKKQRKMIVSWIAVVAVVAIAVIVFARSNDEASDVQTVKNTTIGPHAPVKDVDPNQHLTLNCPPNNSTKETNKMVEHIIAPAKESVDDNQSVNDRHIAVESDAEELLTNEPIVNETVNTNELLVETIETDRNTLWIEEEHFKQQYYMSNNKIRNALEESTIRRLQLQMLFEKLINNATYNI